MLTTGVTAEQVVARVKNWMSNSHISLSSCEAMGKYEAIGVNSSVYKLSSAPSPPFKSFGIGRNNTHCHHQGFHLEV